MYKLACSCLQEALKGVATRTVLQKACHVNNASITILEKGFAFFVLVIQNPSERVILLEGMHHPSIVRVILPMFHLFIRRERLHLGI